MSKRRGWKILAVIAWLVFVAGVASPIAVEYGLIKPVPDGEAKGAVVLLGMMALIAAIVATITASPSPVAEMRAQEIREDAHMRQCRHVEECFHPDHVHPEPEPDWYEEHAARLEEIRAPHGFWERMGS